MILLQSHSSAFAKFRAGVAPLRVETGRYEGLPLKERLCPFLSNLVEDEFHVVFECSLYSELRWTFFRKLQNLMTIFKTSQVGRICLFVQQSANYSCLRQNLLFTTAKKNPLSL